MTKVEAELNTLDRYMEQIMILVKYISFLAKIIHLFYLNFSIELWYGIEWLDVSRGKHDGTYKGRQYFKTQ